jgi:hypothetical protein
MSSNIENVENVIVENVKPKEKKPKQERISAKNMNCLAFGVWFSRHLMDMNILNDETYHQVMTELQLYNTDIEQNVFYNQYNQSAKEIKKDVKKLIKNHRKPPPKPRGKGKKTVSNMVKEMVEKANSNEPIVAADDVPLPKKRGGGRRKKVVEPVAEVEAPVEAPIVAPVEAPIVAEEPMVEAPVEAQELVVEAPVVAQEPVEQPKPKRGRKTEAAPKTEPKSKQSKAKESKEDKPKEDKPKRKYNKKTLIVNAPEPEPEPVAEPVVEEPEIDFGDDDDQDALEVTVDGKLWYIDTEQNVYDPESIQEDDNVPIGIYHPKTNTITFH